MGLQSEMIDSLKAHIGLVSDYAVAQRWQVEPTRISQYRRDRLRLPVRFIIDIATETCTDALFYLAALERERSKRHGREISQTWQPNEKVNRYPPAWVGRKHYFRRNR